MDLKSKKKPRKKVKLRTLFLRYLFIFCMSTLLWGLTIFLTFSLLLSSGIIYPANHIERELEAARKTLAESEQITSQIIPELCSYAVFTTDGKFLSGNMDTRDARNAWNFTDSGTQPTVYRLTHCYTAIPRTYEVCIVRYSVTAQFKSSILRKYFPNPEFLSFVLFVIGFLFGVYSLATAFGKKLSQKMKGLQAATEKIQQQDLDFQVENSDIIEIDKVLSSLDKMKEALKVSLEKQWNLEQQRKEQISALAHDIKTPLTIARGNTDLLSETELTEEQKEYAGYIADSTSQMEHYIKMLIELSKNDISSTFHKQEVQSQAFLTDLKSRINAVLSVKKIQTEYSQTTLPPIFDIDEELLLRAIMNLVANAADYTPSHGKIFLSANYKNGCLCFCVTDFGKGFSQSALKQAAEQFYMEDKSRTKKEHYGMGLYIAKSIAELHGGKLFISNSKDTGGGKVTLCIPC